MRRIGHRGAMGHAPENTIASFEKAIALGCDEVETDVWLGDDGRLLVSHDPPTAGAFLDLDEVLQVCLGRVHVNVELKCDAAGARAAGAHAARVLAARSTAAITLSSFSLDALVGASAAARGLRLAYVFAAPADEGLVERARSLGLSALHPERGQVTARLVAAAHAAALAVHAWTANEVAEIDRLVALGVDGIISDYPERVPRVIDISRRSVSTA